MKRIPFQRPTDHYDERARNIDRELCKLIRQRKEVSDNNPGYPTFEYISNWAKEFDLCDEMLKSVFSSLWNEEQYRAMSVEPTGFRKYLPVLKVIEKDNKLFSVTFIRQYTNCSLVNFDIDWDSTSDLPSKQSQHSYFKLFIGQEYNCRIENGGGSEGHLSYNFLVSPPLPDNVSGLNLVFTECYHQFTDKPTDKSTGVEVVVDL